jgi:hypothetical protein
MPLRSLVLLARTALPLIWDYKTGIAKPHKTHLFRAIAPFIGALQGHISARTYARSA